MADLDIAALRKLADAVKQAPNRAYRCVAENALSDAVADAECGIVYALLAIAEAVPARLASGHTGWCPTKGNPCHCGHDALAAAWAALGDG